MISLSSSSIQAMDWHCQSTNSGGVLQTSLTDKTSHVSLSLLYSPRHWRRPVKNIGRANQNIGGGGKNDKCMGVTQLLGRHVPGLPSKVYAYAPRFTLTVTIKTNGEVESV